VTRVRLLASVSFARSRSPSPNKKMLVLVASTGAAVSVACDAASSVGAVGDALASHPDVAVPRRDQLLIFEGRRLEGETRTLAEYGLPERAGDAEYAAEDEEPRFRSDAEYVFLYRKSALISEKFLGTPSRDGDPSSRDDPVHGLGIVSIDVAPTPPPPRSDGSHPLERAAVAFFVDGSKKIRKGSESDITKTVDVSETSSRLHRLVALERSLEHAAARVEATHAASTARARAVDAACVASTRAAACSRDRSRATRRCRREDVSETSTVFVMSDSEPFRIFFEPSTKKATAARSSGCDPSLRGGGGVGATSIETIPKP